jgi:hypothetical protein
MLAAVVVLAGCNEVKRTDCDGGDCLACEPVSCASMGKNCGTLEDGCGQTLDCGSCGEGETCGGGGIDKVCGSSALVFGGPGPWPMENFGVTTSDGLQELPVVGVSTDESQNLWIATPKALYLKLPNTSGLKRFAAAQGLHLKENPVAYCDNRLGGADPANPHACPAPGTPGGEGHPSLCPIYGAATDDGITEIVGGGMNEVFVGYAGDDTGTEDWCDPNRHTGKLDRVRLNPDGTIQVDRFDLVSNGHGMHYWHNRTVQRMVFDHFIHRHELYVGLNHGVTLLRPDNFREVGAGEWPDTVYMEYMADHLHPTVCYQQICPDGSTGQRMGDWRGLALDSRGELWVAGKWTAGRIRWSAGLRDWFSRPGDKAFAVAFARTYNPPAGTNDPPVFPVPYAGHPVHLTSVAVTTDGRVWFGSEALREGPENVTYGLASWSGGRFTYHDDDLARFGISKAVRDLVALPDGRLVIATPSSGLIVWDPNTGEHVAVRGRSYLPDDRVNRLALDTMVSPPALHVSTAGGAAILRELPGGGS